MIGSRFYLINTVVRDTYIIEPTYRRKTRFLACSRYFAKKNPIRLSTNSAIAQQTCNLNDNSGKGRGLG